jgi:1-acyl-sn-glycerol-3-phosphate acyltransferase
MTQNNKNSMSLSQRIIVGILLPLARIFLSWTVKGQENVPRTEAFILISNHVHSLDPILLEFSFPRWICFMAKEELFHDPILKILLRWSHAVPVRRHGTSKDNRNLVKQAKNILENGMILGIFPEGKRSPDASLTTGKVGPAIIASQSDVPILPVGIVGTDQIKGISWLWRRPQLAINIGEPFRLPVVDGRMSKSQVKSLTSRLMTEIAVLLPQKYQGVYKQDGD